MGKKEKTVRLVKLDWDDECRKDFLCEKAIHITEQPFIKEEKTLHGSHSPLFSSDWDDEEPFADRYTCQCKKLKGRIYEKEECPICLTKVVFRDVDLRLFGWMIIKGFKIIQPAYYKLIRSLIGETLLDEIIRFDKELTKDGHLKSKASKNPFKGIGLIEFRDRFDEIMYYFKEKKKDKELVYDEIMRNRNSVFTASIPQYSPVLRPVSFKGESLFFNPVDKKYNYVLSLIVLLNKKMVGADLSNYKKKRQSMDVPTILYTIQKKMMTLYDTVFVEINQKDGLIKDAVLGGRINYSSRCVIIPDPELRADEIKLSYLAFLELYKYEILSHICKMDNVTMIEASDLWFKASLNFSSKIYEIMKYLVNRKKKKLKVLINRNPTINFGSILCVKIKDVKVNIDDTTMNVPIQILRVLNADFDGDILNIVSLKNKELSRKYSKVSSPKKMFISRNDGLFNNDFALLKDQTIGLYEWNNC